MSLNLSFSFLTRKVVSFWPRLTKPIIYEVLWRTELLQNGYYSFKCLGRSRTAPARVQQRRTIARLPRILAHSDNLTPNDKVRLFWFYNHASVSSLKYMK